MTYAQRHVSVKTRYIAFCEGSALLTNAQPSVVSGKQKEEADKTRSLFIAFEEAACVPYVGDVPSEDSTKFLPDEHAVRFPIVLQEFLPPDQQNRLVRFIV